MSDPLFAPPSLAAIFLVFLLCGLHTFLEEDGCPPALPVALLVVHVLEAALLLVVVVVVVVVIVEVGVGTEVLVGVVVGDVVVGVGVGGSTAVYFITLRICPQQTCLGTAWQ